MNLSIDEAITFTTDNYDDLIALAERPDTSIVVCPSHEALYPLGKLFATTKVSLGGQDCSDHLRGSFTGQTAARSLQQLGCSFCIVGHSERRKFNKESNDLVWKKCVQLIDQNISPILCIGETKEEHKAGSTLSILEQQLNPLVKATAATTNVLSSGVNLFIAYEPVWSIGTGELPSADHLETTFVWLSNHLQKIIDRSRFKLLYGGSVDATTASPFKNIEGLDGFLIGKASLDFPTFKEIILQNK